MILLYIFLTIFALVFLSARLLQTTNGYCMTYLPRVSATFLPGEFCWNVLHIHFGIKLSSLAQSVWERDFETFFVGLFIFDHPAGLFFLMTVHIRWFFILQALKFLKVSTLQIVMVTNVGCYCITLSYWLIWDLHVN